MTALTQGIIPASTYRKIMNGPAMSTVQRVSGKELKPMTNIDGITEGRVKIDNIEKGGIEITLGYSNILRLNPTCRKLLDLLLMRISEIAPYGEEATRRNLAMPACVTVRLEEFMSLFGLKDKRNAREQFREAAHTLLHMWVKFDYITHTKKGRKVIEETKHVDGYLFEATIGIRTVAEEPLRNSRINFCFALTLLEYLCNRFIMPVNVKMFTINPQNNPHSYNLMRRLTEYYDMNATAPNEPVRISVRKLLEHCPEIPTPEEIRKEEAGQISKRIREPFERDLEALEETYGLIKWQYCKRRGIEFEPEEKQPANYPFEDWLDLLIEYYLPAYPVKKAKELHRRKKVETA